LSALAQLRISSSVRISLASAIASSGKADRPHRLAVFALSAFHVTALPVRQALDGATEPLAPVDHHRGLDLGLEAAPQREIFRRTSGRSMPGEDTSR
jgi:hypothetical protein